YSKENSDFEVQVIRSNGFGEPRGPFSRLNSDDALSNANGNTFFGRFDDNRLRQYALFGEASYELSPQLTATVGARYFNSNIKSRQETTHPFGGFGPNPEGVLSNNNTDEKTTFKFNLSWRPNDDVLVYANAAQGFRTGGLNQANLPFASGIPEGYGPDSLWNYEVGTKLSLAENRVSLNIAAYIIDWSDIQVRALDATGAFPFTTNAGKAQIDGIEVELTALLSEGVTVSAGGSYQNARLTEDQAAPNFGLDGDPIPNVPDILASVNFDVDRPFNETFNYVVHADMNYRDGSRTTIAPLSRDSSAVDLDSYVLANFRIGLENDDWSVGLFARNIFDKRAEVDAISSSQDPLARITVRPRTIGASLSRRF
ncbi:MAG TPA: TonB-dependent receptor, partial [Hellea balneolensis]|nr:TonB-dependent receptor [Hellea balneolensis]